MDFYLKKQSFAWQQWLSALAILLVAIVALNLSQSFVRNSFFVVSGGFSHALSSVTRGVGDIANSYISGGTLKQQNEALNRKNETLIAQLADLQDRLRQNSLQATALENAASESFIFVRATVVAVDPQQDSFVINRGSANGLRKDMPVVSAQHVLYGKIVQVGQNSAHVQAISTGASVTDVKIQATDELDSPVNAILRGSGNGNVYLDLVHPDATINQDDVLVTSGLEGLYPKNLPVGKVIRVHSNDLQPFLKADVESFFDIRQTDDLFVITNYTN